MAKNNRLVALFYDPARLKNGDSIPSLFMRQNQRLGKYQGEFDFEPGGSKVNKNGQFQWPIL